ncbi:hypothetical protein QJS10_CPA01g00794 [Acorus calamus]|uniref:OTU domain-containing protein n=1 Tax=Acorus calamus TaxID=4465 RepID=A0AAV9FJ95_ACOCL|nr:hypothetical protein QJS10_CPA01g00794 [Acorus calamus]
MRSVCLLQEHTPRVNGEIPDVDDATLDHKRLSERLSTYGLAELQIEGDGNCQFRALADQLFRNPEYHKHVRKKVVKQLKHHKKLYEGYVPMDYNTYLKNMKRSGEWGDHVTLQAAADRIHASSRLFRRTIIHQKIYPLALTKRSIGFLEEAIEIDLFEMQRYKRRVKEDLCPVVLRTSTAASRMSGNRLIAFPTVADNQTVAGHP